MNSEAPSILAIDNGLTGALALLSCVPGLPPARLVSMPVMRVPLLHRVISKANASGPKAKGKVKAMEANEIDAVALASIIRGFGVAKIRAVIFEDCPDHGDRASTVKSMAGSAGKIAAVLEVLGLGPNIYRVQSYTWQGEMLGKVPKGMTKDYALAAAQSIWPEQNWMRSSRCTTLDTGFIDAALIGMWALRHIPGMADGMGFNAPLVQMLSAP